MIYKPTAIIRCLSSQAVYFNRVYGQMFYYSDQNQIWYDTQDNNRVVANDITILQFERQRNNFVPNLWSDFPSEYGMQMEFLNLQDYSIIYVIETNCLYKYQKGIWTTLYGKYGQQTVAQTYLPDGGVRVVVADDVTTNGILNDGSVVIRDANKMICGLLRSDGYTMNILGLIGGCINIDPSGKVSGDGCLQLNSNPGQTSQPNANLNANLTVFGDIKSVDPTNWRKQYRLITEEVIITSNTTIKSGSTLTSGSKLGTTSYDTDTQLTEDITVTDGILAVNSKIYIDSVINSNSLQPPYLFDTANVESSYIPKAITITSDKITIDNNILKLDVDFSFTNNGDCCFIPVTESLSNITTIQFMHDFEYNVEFIANEGIDNSARIVYYAINNKVKVLP